MQLKEDLVLVVLKYVIKPPQVFFSGYRLSEIFLSRYSGPGVCLSVAG